MEYTTQEQSEMIKSVMEIDEKIQDEINKGNNRDKDKITRLRFEQLLRGMAITQDPFRN
jgi:hypothetical protein